MRYINGELEFPQAIICANDYMAYGLLDKFLYHGIKVPETISVIGYEYIHERHFHHPILTTYKRNRRSLGESAVNMLINKIESNDFGEFTPPKCELISGNTCPCSADSSVIDIEVKENRLKKDYEFVNLYNQLDHRLAECCTIDEFTAMCRQFSYREKAFTLEE